MKDFENQFDLYNVFEVTKSYIL